MVESAAKGMLPRRTWKRWRWIVLLIGLALVVSPLGLYGYGWYVRHRGLKELEEVTKELDTAESGWRLADLIKSRAVVPAEDNGALVVTAARGLMPKEWPVGIKGSESRNYVELGHVLGLSVGVLNMASAGVPIGAAVHASGMARSPVADDWSPTFVTMDSHDVAFGSLAPEVQLDEKQTKWLRYQLQQVTAAVTKARKLADMPRGCFQIEWNPDAPLSSTSLDPLSQSVRVAWLLQYEAILQAQDGDIEGACRSTRAAINSGRSVGYELSTIAMLMRIACVNNGIRSVERNLAQGQPSVATLQSLQKLLEMEEGELPGVERTAFRGERAIWHIELENLFTGQFSSAYYSSGGSGNTLLGTLERLRVLSADQRLFILAPSLHAGCLRRMTKHVEICNLPFAEQEKVLSAFERIDCQKPVNIFSALFTGCSSRACVVCCLTRHGCACAIVALAAERYRREFEKWPVSLEALVAAKFLEQEPVDPYDGKPIRLRRTEDGLIVYTVGPDREDNGGNLAAAGTYPERGTDVGIRLWDVGKRRQPAAEQMSMPHKVSPGPH